MGLYIVELGIRLFFRFLFTQFTWVSDSFMEIFPVKPHSVFIFELILTPCLWLVNHTGYRIRIYPLGTLLKLLKTGLPPFTERSIFRIIFFYLSRTYFHRKGHFKCTQQLCEHRQHMQEFPQSQPLQPQLDHFLQKKYSWAHRTWWAQKWFHVSFSLTF